MHERRGKGMRVTGFFFLLLGAGIIIDSDANLFGTVIGSGGAALLIAGLVQARPNGKLDSPARPTA